jgi:xanthine dehydrogenase small subunit
LVSKARFAFGGVAATPLRAVEAEACIEGTHFAEVDLARATAQLRRTLTPLRDHRGSAAYRLAMAQSLLEKFRSEAR